jgi:hypothetical protein
MVHFRALHKTGLNFRGTYYNILDDQLKEATIRGTYIRLRDKTGAVWMELWHAHKYNPETRFFTQLWITIQSQEQGFISNFQ